MEIARRRAGAVRDGVGRVARVAPDAFLIPRAVGQRVLGALGDRGHHLDGLARILADRRLLGEHHGVGSVEDRVGHVGHLGTGGAGGVDHRVEHLGGRDRGAGEPARHAQQLFLDDRDVFDRQLDAEIAARDHHAVGRADDFLRGVDRLRLLDLCHQR